MLDTKEIVQIREMANSGHTVSEIAKEVEVDRKTVKKYLEQDDFSPSFEPKAPKPSILDPYKPIVDEWLREDLKVWYKQRHTAQRIYDRLQNEHKFTGSYSVVQRYVKEARAGYIQTHGTRGTIELIWEPGHLEVDFGEIKVNRNEESVPMKFLATSFPHSNNGFTQLFGGETAECVCQGLQDIFEYIGGVPPVIIFDNATGVGKRFKDKAVESKLFSQFRCHYGFVVRFCNPYSGHEKGNVENKVNYIRHNVFVPTPTLNSVDDLIAYNRKLMTSMERKAEEEHYKKGTTIKELFEEDRAALKPLPSKPFDVCTYKTIKADGYGKVKVGEKHFYSTCPEFAHTVVNVGVRAHYVDILSKDGELIVRHPREYREGRVDITDYSTFVNALAANPGSWYNNGIRLEVDDVLRNYLDSLEQPEQKTYFKMLRDLSTEYGFKTATTSMSMALRDNKIAESDAKVIAERITGYGIDTPPTDGPSLEEYDKAFLGGISKEEKDDENNPTT